MSLTWTQHTTPTATNNVWYSVAWSDTLNLFCAVGAVNAAGTNSHRIMTSPDGTNWTIRDSGVTAANSFISVVWAGGTINKFVVIKTSGTNRVITSIDGFNWVEGSGIPADVWLDICYSDTLGRLVAVGQTAGVGNQVMYSDDAATWTTTSSVADKAWGSVIWAGGSIQKFIATASTQTTAQVMTSVNGIAWVTGGTPFAGTSQNPVINNIAAGTGRGLAYSDDLDMVVAVMSNNNNPIWTSTNASSWNQRTVPTTGGSRPVWRNMLAIPGNGFLGTATKGAANTNQVITSPDGIVWTEADPAVGTIEPWRSVAYSPALNLVVAVADNTTNDGTSAMSAQLAASFINPTSGSSLGGTAVTLTGDGLNGNFSLTEDKYRVLFDVSGIITAQTVKLADVVSPYKFWKGDGTGTLVEVTSGAEITTINATCYGYTVDPNSWFPGNPIGTANHVAKTSSTILTCQTGPGTGTVAVIAANTNSAFVSGEYTVEVVQGQFEHLNLAFYLPSAYEYVAIGISGIDPNVGCTNTDVTIYGAGFAAGATVTFGGVAATNVTVVSDSVITCTTPSHADGLVDVVVTNTDASTATLTNGFRYATPFWVSQIRIQVLGGIPELVIREQPESLTFNNTCTGAGFTVTNDVLTASTVPTAGPVEFTLIDTVQSCTQPDDTYLLFGSTSPSFAWFRYPPLNWFVYGPRCPGLGWELINYTPDPQGWYVSPSGFGGDIVVIANGRPKDPRQWADIATFAAGDASMLGGSPAASVTFNNHIVYPATGYAVGTDHPPIRIFDGGFDHELAKLPSTTANATPKAVMSMLAAGGSIYLTSYDTGTDASTWAGRVFTLDIDSGVLTPVGTSGFSSGHLPYALAWHAGRLWLGTNKGDGTAGKVYFIRPGIDTDWTVDHDMATNTLGGVCSMVSYGGKLYVGSDNVSGSRGKIIARATDGTYTVVETGSGGALAHVNNGYIAMSVFNGNLYASYWNNDTPAISKIRQFDGTTWSTVYTGSGTTLKPFICFLLDGAV